MQHIFFAPDDHNSGTTTDPPEAEWRKRVARLVLEGNVPETLSTRIEELVQLLDFLIVAYRGTDYISLDTLKDTSELWSQLESNFLGVSAWQKAQSLDNRIKALASINAVQKSQHCLAAISGHMRPMKILVEQLKNDPGSFVASPSALDSLTEHQGKVAGLLKDLRDQATEFALKIQQALSPPDSEISP